MEYWAHLGTNSGAWFKLEHRDELCGTEMEGLTYNFSHSQKGEFKFILVKVFHMVSCIVYRLQADVADLQVNQLLSSLICYS